MSRKWIAYVYALTKDDQILYIGKGTGNRLQDQRRNFGLAGHELAWFKTEKDAYKFERQLVRDIDPWLNRCAGGAGSYSRKPPEPRYKPSEDEILMQQIGTRAYCCRLLLAMKNKGLVTMDDMSENVYRAIGYGIVWAS